MIYGDEPINPVEVGFENERMIKIQTGFNNFMEHGLTIRQHFAAMAMQGILANSEFMKNYQDVDIHRLSVKNADSLIAELNKESK